MAEAIRDTGELVPSNKGTSPPPEAGKLAVFISYSRDDLGFADQLDAALKLTNFDPTLDRHGISGAENWQEKLGGLIRSADTVVFVLSPSSAKSKVCTWEVEEAIRLGKRIIPVVARPLEDTTPPKHLADLNYIFFFEEPRSPGSGFGTAARRGPQHRPPLAPRAHTPAPARNRVGVGWSIGEPVAVGRRHRGCEGVGRPSSKRCATAH
jgi:hypothetical protein